MRKDPCKTPRSKVKAAIRQCWLRSRERNAALKAARYTCARCGSKQSTAKGREVKVCAHHIEGIDWDGIVDIIFVRVLQTPEAYEVLCVECHAKEHGGKP